MTVFTSPFLFLQSSMKTNVGYSGINSRLVILAPLFLPWKSKEETEALPAMSRAPSRLDSLPAASSPTKPTFSLLWSACGPANTPPLRDFCTMMEACGSLRVPAAL